MERFLDDKINELNRQLDEIAKEMAAAPSGGSYFGDFLLKGTGYGFHNVSDLVATLEALRAKDE